MENIEGKTTDQTAALEAKEQNAVRFAPFLGGFFSTGGRMGFNIENQKKRLKGSGEVQYTYAYPIISYNDNRKTKIERLRNLFGGRTLPPEGESHRWYIKSEEAVELAISMKDYSPSRAETIAGFENWVHAEDLADRVTIAREVNQAIRTKQMRVHKGAYNDLVENPLFLAGVFESRGFLYNRSKGDHALEPVIEINSENVQLLEAIKERYGGGISVATENSRCLTIGRAATRGILQSITPHLLSPLSEYQRAA